MNKKVTTTIAICILAMVVIFVISLFHQQSQNDARYQLGFESEMDQNSLNSDYDSDIDRIEDEVTKLKKSAKDDYRDYIEAKPVFANIGETVIATNNLAVSVLKVDKGPFDYGDMSPTVKVTVKMDNLTDKALTVKASNWDADNSDGERVDHKLWVKDASGAIVDKSFEITRISPKASFTSVVYFDGEYLKDVVYEPHWLISPQNQYIYFNV